MLARTGDPLSDVDYMVVFKDGASSTPAALLARLRRFVENQYSTSEVKQSNPTVVLTLGHIMFDLVPAYENYSTYYIPGPAGGYVSWTSTDPTGFNPQLTSANGKHNHRIKPTIRLVKYWNAKVGCPFESFALERSIVNRTFFVRGSLREYVYDAFGGLQLPWDAALWTKDRLARVQTVAAEAKRLEGTDMPISAEAEIRKIIPAL